MSEPTCPGCGAEWDHGTQPTNVWIMYKCDSVYREGVLYRVSKACLLRQLVQRDERNAALEARIKELEADRWHGREVEAAMTETCPGCGAELRVEITASKPTPSEGMPVCAGCHRHHRENSEWVVFSDKTWWHALCAADELHRQLAQRDEKIAALEVRALKLEKALRRLADANPLRGRALHGNDKLPGCEEFYRGYNAGVDTQLAFSSEIARKALEEVGHE